MAGVYGVNYKKAYIDNPSQMIPAGEQAGRVRVAYDEITFEANVLAISDVVKLFKIPKGARVLGFRAVGASLGTTGILDFGYAANGVDLADPDAFISGLDLGGARASKVDTTEEGIGKKFEAETEIQAVFTEASDGALGDKLQAWCYYVLD